MLEHWGTTPAERALRLPCDELVPDGQLLTRAVDTTAAPAVVFLWFCQMRVAPYSYDWIDNLGRRSPRTLTPGLDALELGQRFAHVFRLAHFQKDEHLTIHTRGRSFGELAMSYAARPGRILLRIRVAHPGPLPERRIRGAVLPGLDLVMARRQLLNFASIAERTPR